MRWTESVCPRRGTFLGRATRLSTCQAVRQVQLLPRSLAAVNPGRCPVLTATSGRGNNILMNLSDSWAARRPVTARVSAAEAVLADLREAITSGELSVGERLPSEASLAARHGVSRSVIREALRSC